MLSAGFRVTPARVSDREEKKHSWARLTQTFAQDTTFHGIKYIAEDTEFPTRR